MQKNHNFLAFSVCAISWMSFKGSILYLVHIVSSGEKKNQKPTTFTESYKTCIIYLSDKFPISRGFSLCIYYLRRLFYLSYIYAICYADFFPTIRICKLGTILLLQWAAAWEMEDSSASNKIDNFQILGRGLCSWKQAPHLSSHKPWEGDSSRLQLKISLTKKTNKQPNKNPQTFERDLLGS